MERFIHKMFRFYYILIAFPYILSWEPGLRTKFSLKRNTLHFTLWLLSFGLCAVYFLVALGFLHTLVPIYLTNLQYDKLSFHCLWTAFALNFLSQQLPHLFKGQQVIQLGNGLTDFVKNIEQG